MRRPDRNGNSVFISHVNHWINFPRAGFMTAMVLAGMAGRSTPARALNQMTKRQKATDSGTPENPLRGSIHDAVETTAFEGAGKKAAGEIRSGAGEMSGFKSNAAGINGGGV